MTTFIVVDNLSNEFNFSYETGRSFRYGGLSSHLEVIMSILPDVIVYFWLLPLFIYVVFPLSLSVLYSLGRLMHFMFNPAPPKVEKTA